MDGLVATRQIRNRWPAGTGPRIIAMTANVLQEDQEACFAAGMDDYLVKPLMPEELLRKIGLLLHRHPQQRALGESPHAPSGYLVIRPASLQEVTGGDAGMERELISLFLKESGEALERMKACTDQADWEGLYKATHFIKPSFYLFGVEEARQLFPSLEKLAKSSPQEAQVRPMLHQVRNLREACVQDLERYLRQLPA